MNIIFMLSHMILDFQIIRSGLIQITALSVITNALYESTYRPEKWKTNWIGLP